MSASHKYKEVLQSTQILLISLVSPDTFKLQVDVLIKQYIHKYIPILMYSNQNGGWKVETKLTILLFSKNPLN